MIKRAVQPVIDTNALLILGPCAKPDGQDGGMTLSAPVRPATISPRRQVPGSIARPRYVDSAGAADLDDPMVKDADTIARMRIAGRIAADALVEVGQHVAPGVTTDELDRIGHEYLIDHGAYPSTLGYKGFPKSLCTSVNEVICHGIPDSASCATATSSRSTSPRTSTACTATPARRSTSATSTPEVRDLGERTREAMMRGIRAVQPGRPISVIGRVIESYAQAIRLRRGARLHRARRRPELPHQADDPALRRTARRPRCSSPA